MFCEEADLELGAELADGSFTIVHSAVYKGTQAVCVKVRGARGTAGCVASSTVSLVQGFSDLIATDIAASPVDSPVRRAFMAELEAELRDLFALKHDNVVQCYSVCLDAVTRLPKWVILQLAQQSYSSYVRRLRGVGLPVRAFADQWRDVLSGLAYMHGRPCPVAHGDLRGRNILVNTLHCGGTRLLINDLTIKRMAAAGNRPYPRWVGYEFYRAPECAVGTGPTPPGDVYSVGVMMAEVAVCAVAVGDSRVPNPVQVFGVGGVPDMCARACDVLRPLCPPLADLLRACCAPVPTARITAADALTALQGILATLPRPPVANIRAPPCALCCHVAVCVCLPPLRVRAHGHRRRRGRSVRIR